MIYPSRQSIDPSFPFFHPFIIPLASLKNGNSFIIKYFIKSIKLKKVETNFSLFSPFFKYIFKKMILHK